MKIMFLTVILWLGPCCLPASADLFSIVLQPVLLQGAPGAMVSFSGTLTNNTESDLYLNLDSLNLTGLDPSSIDDTPWFLNTPSGFLDPNGTTGVIGLFNIAIPTPFLNGDYAGTFQILGGQTSDDQTLLGSANFTLEVLPGGSPSVPEPSTFVLLGMTLAGALAWRYRRGGPTVDRERRGRRPEFAGPD